MLPHLLIGEKECHVPNKHPVEPQSYIVVKKEKGEGWWLVTIDHAQLSGFISNVLPSPGKLVEGACDVNAVKLTLDNQSKM